MRIKKNKKVKPRTMVYGAKNRFTYLLIQIEMFMLVLKSIQRKSSLPIGDENFIVEN